MIGALFKLNMLIEPIIHECIKKLLAQGDEESLECLCCLLESVGKELDERPSEYRNSNLVSFLRFRYVILKMIFHNHF